MTWQGTNKAWDAARLFGLLLEEGDEVVAVLGLLETTEGHLGAGNVLLGVLEVLELGRVSSGLHCKRCGTYESVVVPLNTLLLVGVGVRETLNLARLAAEETV